MRRYLAFGFAVALVGLVGCNGGKKSGDRAAAAAAVSSGSTGGTTSGGTTGGGTTGGSTGTSADAPQVTGLAPTNGPVDGGTAVIISGSNFTKSGAGQTLVLFGTRAVVVTPTSDTTIQVTAPLQLQPGAVDVRVINDLGVDALAGAFRYDPTTAALSFSPAVGSTDLATMSGTEITIDVRGFAPLTPSVTVSFGAAAATSVTVIDGDTVRAEVPYGISAGPTTITVTDGGTTATAQGFEVQGALAYGDVVINELLFDPAGDANQDRTSSTTADEFVEIVNTTTKPVDLTWLHLVDDAAGILHRFANPTILPPGGAIVVFGAGNPNGFEARNVSGHAQTSSAGSLGLRNGTPAEILRIEDPNNPNPSTFAPAVLFHVTLLSPGAGTSYVNKNDGQRITANPATSADYEAHPARTAAQGSVNHSAGKKKDGSSF